MGERGRGRGRDLSLTCGDFAAVAVAADFEAWSIKLGEPVPSPCLILDIEDWKRLLSEVGAFANFEPRDHLPLGDARLAERKREAFFVRGEGRRRKQEVPL